MQKLFITDLDGTLLNKDKKVSSEANEILKQFDNVGVATGRNIFSVYNIIKNVAINSHLILCNGACVYNMDQDTFEAIVPLKQDLYSRLEALINEITVKPIVIGFKDSRPYFQYVESYNKQYDKFLNYAKAYPSKLDSKVTNYNFDTRIVEMIYYSDKDEILKIKSMFEKEFPDQFMYECRYSIMVDDEKLWFLAIFDNTVGKGSAIKEMAKRYDVDLSEVYVFGDGQNDIDMFKLDVNKIAVKNAVNELLELADVIIEENTKDSVIKYIQEKNR